MPLGRHLKIACLCTALGSAALLHSHETSAAGLDQSNAQDTAAKLNHRGSDDSMQASTNNVMIAIMNLSALNIPGAFSHGYQAYGQYINSEKLDDLEYKTMARRNIMSSANGGGPVGGSSNGPRKTTYSRLDPEFLSKGGERKNRG